MEPLSLGCLTLVSVSDQGGERKRSDLTGRQVTGGSSELTLCYLMTVNYINRPFLKVPRHDYYFYIYFNPTVSSQLVFKFMLQCGLYFVFFEMLTNPKNHALLQAKLRHILVALNTNSMGFFVDQGN